MKALFLFFAAMFAAILPAYSQDVQADPAAAVTDESIAAMTAAITLFITYFSGLIPGLKNIKSGVIRAIAVGVVVVFAVIEFRFGWFTKDSFDAILQTLAPTFAYSGFAWEVIKTLLGFFKIDLKAMQPGAPRQSTVPPNVNHTL